MVGPRGSCPHLLLSGEHHIFPSNENGKHTTNKNGSTERTVTFVATRMPDSTHFRFNCYGYGPRMLGKGVYGTMLSSLVCLAIKIRLKGTYSHVFSVVPKTIKCSYMFRVIALRLIYAIMQPFRRKAFERRTRYFKVFSLKGSSQR